MQYDQCDQLWHRLQFKQTGKADKNSTVSANVLKFLNFENHILYVVTYFQILHYGFFVSLLSIHFSQPFKGIYYKEPGCIILHLRC